MQATSLPGGVDFVPSIFVYSLKLENVFGDGFDSTSKKIAKLLAERQIAHQFIDLRSNGLYAMGNFIRSESVNLVIDGQLSAEFQQELVKCVNLKTVVPLQYHSNLKLLGLSNVSPSVTIEEKQYINPGLSILSTSEKVYKIGKTPIPSLTNGPATGLRDQSWNHACERDDAKEWLQASGIAVKPGDWLKLVDCDGKEVHTIGSVASNKITVRS